VQDDKERLIREIAEMLADWESGEGETYRDLAVRIVEKFGETVCRADGFPEKSDDIIC
jgi:hypothetical protein